MNNTATPLFPCCLQPIQDHDLDRVCQFYHTHLNQNISVDAWKNAFSQPWSSAPPNHGFMLLAEERVVGVFGAIYSEQVIQGRLEAFCNHASWMVLEEYRQRSLELLTTLLAQPGFHMTSLTPNPNVTEICTYFGLQPLSDRMTVIPNFPWSFSFNSEVITDRQEIMSVLPPGAIRDYRNHCSLPWLGQVALGRAGSYCYVVFKQKRWKRMPAVMLLHLSDPEIFLRHYSALGYYLLWRFGVTTLHVPTRFLPHRPARAFEIIDSQPRLFLTDRLTERDLSFLYTEVVALDLPL